MKLAIIAAVAASTVLAFTAPPAHADPAPPVQCKPTGGTLGTQACRYADGTLQLCSQLLPCQPYPGPVPPGFWEQP